MLKLQYKLYIVKLSLLHSYNINITFSKMRLGKSLISKSVESNRAEQNLVNADLQPSITPCKTAKM